MKTIIVILLLASNFSFFAEASSNASLNETLMGLTYDQEGFTIQVKSGGCTHKDSFEFFMAESFPMQLSITRKSSRMCQAYVPYGVKLTYSYEELGFTRGDKFFVTNKIEANVIVVR